MPNILQDPEQAVEVEEELALDDRKLPLAFNYPRHQDSICGMETESQVGLVVSACRCLTAIFCYLPTTHFLAKFEHVLYL